ncbi:histidine kinase CKI1 [Magnolia sinica]|uniref:histidine kinase CKI1 n=1 Tax=Magnolia sinica TaxID=86752 RepID=UPI00265A6532|nr:histidine kinase CKI1 [Magnolia sinica]
MTGVAFSLGTGESMCFWEDVWRGDVPLCISFLAIARLTLDLHVMINRCFELGGGSMVWSLPFRQLLRDCEVDEYVALLEFLHFCWLSSNEKDSLGWPMEKSGCFSGLVVVVLPPLVILAWCFTAGQVERAIHVVSVLSKDAYTQLLSNIRDSARSLLPINATTLNLARVLNSSLNANLSSFPTVENKVALYLFLVFSTVPNLSQVSYIGEDGMFFSYYIEGNQTFALFANSSYATTNDSIAYRWYRQPTNEDTGLLFGEAIDSTPVILTKSSWFFNALNNENGYSMWGLGWGKAQEPLFLCMAPVKDFRGQRGVISLGVPVKVLTNFISGIDLHGGNVYLATKDGQLLVQTGPTTPSIAFDNGTVLMQAKKSDNGIAVKSHFNLSCSLDASSGGHDSSLIASKVNFLGTRYEFYCTPLEIAGVQSISILAFPHKEFADAVHRQSKIALVLLVLMLIIVLLVSFFFIIMIFRAAKREVFLSSTLIKQMEATQQAERKSMNKSIAFARASHDVRTSLAAIIGLVELCRMEVSPRSEMETNLIQMNTCALNLLGILNSVLDTSKIEAGKMQLEEGEFDMAQVLEEVVDIFYVIASKKGVDVMLDPCDASVLKASLVKGDCGRFKQVLCNLLSNAVKFTTEGHVVVRAWAKKPNLENSILTYDQGGRFLNLWQRVSHLIYKNSNAYNDLGSLHQVQKNPNSIEFVFEVDDTGKGIPKEKWNSVFENFVQVKEPASGVHEGTGLGLGIVQSLVRLMGGEIGIVDKERGERGTCFKFNIFVQACEITRYTNAEGEEIKLLRDQIRSESHQPHELSISAQPSAINIQSPMSVRAATLGKSLSQDSIHAVLMIKGDEARGISQKWMEHHGIKVWPVSRLDELYLALEKLEYKFASASIRSHSSNSASYNSSGEREGPASAGVDCVSSPNMGSRDPYRKTSLRSAPNCILIVIDMSSGPFFEACSILAKFFKNTHGSRYKVVWVSNPNTPRKDLSRLKNRQAPCDLILQKPFHRARIHELLRLLQESGGSSEDHPSEIRTEKSLQESPRFTRGSPSMRSDQRGSPSMKPDQIPSNSITLQSTHPTRQGIGAEGSLTGDKPLSGMNILLAEDNVTLTRVGVAILRRQGATVECCENGEEALHLVIKALHGIRDGLSKTFAYDIILMDCEMPIMDGYEATRQIRAEERYYDLHIPIIALTAHVVAEEVNKAVQAGMDFHLVKPLKPDRLLEAIRSINRN